MSPATLLGIVLVSAFVIGFLLMANGFLRLTLALIGAMVVVFLYCLLVPKTGQGFEDLGYVIVAWLIAVPGALGLAGGAFIGWMRSRRLRRD